MPNNESVDIFGRRRRHPEKRRDCAANKPERKPTLATLIKRAEKAGKTVTAITTDGVTLTFGEAQTKEKETNDLDKWIANNADDDQRH
jgi:hypothetical protein